MVRFHSYHVPGDGDCLFTSIKELLKLHIPIQELRLQVVEHLEAENNVCKMNVINEHCLRDPAWTRERRNLLDSSNPDHVMGHRYTVLWERYRAQMLRNGWGGNAEMSAIANLYFVNVVVWSLAGGTVRMESRIVSGAADARTLHLRWVSEMHYEYTDIPETFLPPAPDQAASATDVDQPAPSRASARSRKPTKIYDV